MRENGFAPRRGTNDLDARDTGRIDFGSWLDRVIDALTLTHAIPARHFTHTDEEKSDRLSPMGRETEGHTVIPLIHTHRAETAAICRRFHVQRLELFGWAARDNDFEPGRSDVDFLVTYDPGEAAPSLSDYFELTDQLAALLGCPVDLVMSGAVRNPFVHADIERTKQPVYAA